MKINFFSLTASPTNFDRFILVAENEMDKKIIKGFMAGAMSHGMEAEFVYPDKGEWTDGVLNNSAQIKIKKAK